MARPARGKAGDEAGCGDAPRLSPAMVSFRALVFDFVREYWARWDQSPSYGEIAAQLDTSRTKVKKAVHALAAEGRIVRVPGPRGLRLPSEQEAAARKLAELGWRIDREAGVAAPPCPTDAAARSVTDRPLLPPPELTYPAARAGTGQERNTQDDPPED